MPWPMRDLVVVVPGILGSELCKDDKMLWGFQEGLRGLLRFRGDLKAAIDDLKLTGDDPNADYLDDGVKPTRLLSAPQVVAGLSKSDGYDTLRENLFRQFQLRGAASGRAPANYLEFPYDWRRDNRASARRLAKVVPRALHELRRVEPNAKVIFICHSMGGLVTRYYLEMLGGWSDCRALITLGTPYRGAVNALHFLVEGYRLAGVVLTDVLRTCTAVYQLLPTYPMIDADKDEHSRVSEILHKDVSQPKAIEAYEQFHRPIADSIRGRASRGYEVYSIAGVDQETLQSAEWDGVTLTTSGWIPPDWPNYRATGDGTVPYVSTIPPEATGPLGEFTVPGVHAMLQSDAGAWNHVRAILSRLQDDTLARIQGSSLAADERPPALQVQFPDCVRTGEATIRARVLRESAPIKQLTVQVRAAVGGATTLQAMAKVGADWVATIPQLPDGLYRAKVSSVYQGPGAPGALEDVFEVDRTPLD